jgi:hypothetical protein
MDLAFLPDKLLNKINNEYFNKDDITYYIYELVKYLELNEFYNGVIYDDTKCNTFATYNSKTKYIRLFYDVALKEGQYEALYIKCDDILFTNIFIIETILHEVIHMYQAHCYKYEKLPFVDLLYRQYKYTSKCDSSIYELYYDYFTFEREAESIAIENVLVLLRKLVPDYKLFSYYVDLLKKEIVTGYNIRNNILVSPLESIYQSLFHEDVPTIGIDDNYVKLKLGLPVSKRTLYNFKSNYQDIIIDKNNLHV